MKPSFRRFALGTVLLCLVPPSAYSAADPAPDVRVEAPKPAPELTLPGLDGRPQSLTAYRGKVVLVNFWATYCKPCRDEMPSLDRLRERLSGKGFEVIGVDVADEPEAVRRFLAQSPVRFPILLDGEGRSMAAWNALGLPTSFLLDRQGRIRMRVTGGAHWDGGELSAAVEKLLAGRMP